MIQKKDKRIPKLQPAIPALIALWFKPSVYIQMALENDIAVNFKSADFRNAYEKGVYPSESQVKEIKERCLTDAVLLKQNIKKSLIWTTIACTAAIFIAWATGRIDTNLPIQVSKIVFAVGAFLGGWGAALQLAIIEYPKSYAGTTLPERIFNSLTFLLFWIFLIISFFQAIF